MKGFRSKFFYTMHSISVLDEEAKSLFYIEYSIYTNILVLLIRAVNCSEMQVRCDILKVLWFGIDSGGRIVYIVDHILISYNPQLYYMLCLTLSFRFPPSF